MKWQVWGNQSWLWNFPSKFPYKPQLYHLSLCRLFWIEETFRSIEMRWIAKMYIMTDKLLLGCLWGNLVLTVLYLSISTGSTESDMWVSILWTTNSDISYLRNSWKRTLSFSCRNHHAQEHTQILQQCTPRRRQQQAQLKVKPLALAIWCV